MILPIQKILRIKQIREKYLINKSVIYKFSRFFLVGVLNTLIDLLVLNLLVYILNVSNPYIFALCKGFSFMIAVINSYFMNKYFTFRKKDLQNKNFYLFVIISVVGLIINIVISGLSFYLLGIYSNIIPFNLIATVSGIMGAIFSMIINYICYSYFVFK